jgi:transposase-like protein
MRKSGIKDSRGKSLSPQLREITKAYKAFRRVNGGRGWYPVELRGMVLAAIKGGEAISAVARAAGVCEQSLNNWRKEAIVTPRELSVIGEKARSQAADMAARIHLRSGVAIEVPVAALTAEFMLVLASGGAQCG